MPVRKILVQIGVPVASYYRYRRQPEPVPRKLRGKRVPPATPLERQLVCEHAVSQPHTGYKRLADRLANDAIVGPYRYQVLEILHEEGLVKEPPARDPTLNRPAPPDGPNQIWHIDLMYVRIFGRWMYLVDVIDAYSRYLVGWTLNRTMEAFTVTMTTLEALEHQGSPRVAIVRDRGSQFQSQEWQAFVRHHEIRDVRTRVSHPESSGVVARLRRPHRRAAQVWTEEWSIERACQEMETWARIYNWERPHGSLHGLPPAVYHYGEPEAALAQRQAYVRASAEARADYWRRNETIGGCQLEARGVCLTSF